MRKPSVLQILLATLGIAIGGSAIVYGAVTGISYLYSNGLTNPGTTYAGYLKSGDGGVSLMNAPAPTAVDQVLGISSLGTQPQATWRTVAAPDGGVSGEGTAGYIPEWTGTHVLGNSTLQESTNTLYRKYLGSSAFDLQSFVQSTGAGPFLYLRHSYAGTLNTLGTTVTNANLGWVGFFGVNTSPAWMYGAFIYAAQTGDAGSYVPTKLVLGTSSASAANLTQLVLNFDNSVSMSGPVVAANLPYCKQGQVLQGGTSNATSTNTNTVTDRTCQNPSWTNTPLAGSAPPLVAAGPSTAGTATSARRSDDVVGLAASNPNKGDFYRSPVGTDTATNTNANWDHAPDLPRYAGSGSADPSQSPGVPGPVLSFYYQTAHATDAGTVFDLWWKSGGSDTAWTRLASGSGSGSPPALDLTSPLGTITIETGGGHTTEDVVYGHAAHTALEGSEWGATNGVCPLDPNTMVPLANLYPSTESHAGTMSAADKIILDNMVSDTYEVKAAAGTTPGYLSDVVESPDSSITWGISGNYVTAAVNFGTGTSQVCSGATCAGLQPAGDYQPALPGCKAGQEWMGGTGTVTTTNTNTVTMACQNPPWQPAGNYEPAQAGKPGQVEMFGTVTSIGTATTTTTVKTPQNSPWQPALSAGTPGQVLTIDTATLTNTQTATKTFTQSNTFPGTMTYTINGTGTVWEAAAPAVANVSTVHNIATATSSSTVTALATALLGDNVQVTIPPASSTAYGVAKITSNRNITTSTASTTAASTAGAVALPSDAQVQIPVASTSQQGIAKVASSATIGSSTSTASASSTVGAVCMPSDATANGDHKALAAATASTPRYLNDALYEYDGTIQFFDYYWPALGDHVLALYARAGSNSQTGALQLDPNTPNPVGGTAEAGSWGKASDSGHRHASAGNFLGSTAYSPSGNPHTFTKNSRTGWVHVLGYGGGGGGGGCYCQTELPAYCAAGGGAGAGQVDVWINMTGFSTCTAIYVGTGGAGGVVDGSAGNSSQFICNGTTYGAGGGGGGFGMDRTVTPYCLSYVAGALGAKAGGGTACGGYAGQTGCGVPGGASFMGVDWASAAHLVSGIGGGQGGGQAVYAHNNGVSAVGAQGGGGGGAVYVSGSNTTGGAGAPGFLRFEEFSAF